MPRALRTLLCALLLTALASSISAQFRLFGPRSPRPTPQPNSRCAASAYISSQPPLKVNQSLLKQATPDNVHVVVSLPKQRAYLMIGEQIVADSPISSGKAGHTTPSGNFSVLKRIRTIVPASMATSSTALAGLFAPASAPRLIPRLAEHIMSVRR
jgi:L,D-transpeptidase catalytic domain.